MDIKIRISKHEIRNKSEIRNSKHLHLKNDVWAHSLFWILGILTFAFVSDFDIRASRFAYVLPTVLLV